MKQILILAACAAVVALVACKSSSNTTSPVDASDVFGFKVGTSYVFEEFQVDTSTGKSIPGTLNMIHSHVISTTANVYGKSNVAVIVDSVRDGQLDTLITVDTSYFAVEGNGARILQYGFVAGLVQRYANGALPGVAQKWNMLVATDSTTMWTTDTTSVPVAGLGTAFETLQGSNQGRAAYTVGSQSLHCGIAYHQGSISLGAANAPIQLTVLAIFNPTVIGSIATQPSKLLTYKINEYERILMSFTTP